MTNKHSRARQLHRTNTDIVTLTPRQRWTPSIHDPKGVNLQFSPNIRKISLSFLASMMLLAGCGNRDVLFNEVNEFNKSVQVGAEAIDLYYSSINEQDLQLYLLVLELNSNCEVGDFINYECLQPNYKKPASNEKPDSKKFQPSPLKQPAIPLASIQARTVLLKEIADYSRSLTVLAGDNSAEKFQTNVKSIQSRLSSLETKFQQLGRNSDNPTDAQKSLRYVNPIATIVSILGKIAVQESKWSEIRKSVIEAEMPVNTVLSAIADDLDTYAQPVTSVNANIKYSLLINNYNHNFSRLSQSERAVALARIVNYKKAYDFAANFKPSTIPNDILDAHKKLVKIAKSDGSVNNIAELRASLEKFKDDAAQLKEAVNQLAQIPGGK